MRARFEICIEGGPFCGFAGVRERDDFGVTHAVVRVEALAENPAIFNDHRADHDAGAGETYPFLGQFEAASNVNCVIQGCL